MLTPVKSAGYPPSRDRTKPAQFFIELGRQARKFGAGNTLRTREHPVPGRYYHPDTPQARTSLRRLRLRVSCPRRVIVFDIISILMVIHLSSLTVQIATGTTDTVDGWAISALTRRVQRFLALPRWRQGMGLAIFVNITGLLGIVGVVIALDAPLAPWWQWWTLTSCLAAGLWVLWSVLQWGERKMKSQS